MPFKEEDGSFIKIPVIVFMAKNFKKSNMQIFEILLKYGASVNDTDTKGYTGLIYAVKSNKMDLVKYFLTQDIDVTLVDHKGRNVVHHVV